MTVQSRFHIIHKKTTISVIVTGCTECTLESRLEVFQTDHLEYPLPKSLIAPLLPVLCNLCTLACLLLLAFSIAASCLPTILFSSHVSSVGINSLHIENHEWVKSFVSTFVIVFLQELCQKKSHSLSEGDWTRYLTDSVILKLFKYFKFQHR